MLICVVTIIVASRLDPAPDAERVRGLTYDSVDRAAVRASWDGRDVAATVVILGLVAAVYLYFSFWVS